MNHINKIAIELEGGWINIPDECMSLIKSDGSVHVPNNNNGCLKSCDCQCETCHESSYCCKTHLSQIGEIPSPPLNINELLPFIDRNYPDKVDRSCGAHVHFSFNSMLDYSRLLDRKFFYYMLDVLETWGRNNKLNKDGIFWTRIKGKNKFCRRLLIPDNQLNQRHSARYTILNAHAFNQHGTLEIRVLPMFQKKELTLLSVKLLNDLIETFLSQPYKVKKHKVKVRMCDIHKLRTFTRHYIDKEVIYDNNMSKRISSGRGY